jgi:hypothetical protein
MALFPHEDRHLIPPRYGPYPIRGEQLQGEEDGLSLPGAVLSYDDVGDEDQGYGYDGLEKVAHRRWIWHCEAKWVRVAEWYARQLRDLGWSAFAGDQHRKATAWPWEVLHDTYLYDREGEEFRLDHIAEPDQIAIVRFDRSLQAYVGHTWFDVVHKAWTLGHERYPS